MKNSQGILQVKDLCKHFTLHMQGGKRLVGCDQVTFQLDPGEFLGIVGPSGAGKSTILKCLYRTYLPTGGQILYRTSQEQVLNLVQSSEQEMIQLRRQEISYVSQFLKVIPRVSALDVVAEGLQQKDWEPEQAREQARELLTLMRIDSELWDAYPSTFSGGEQQRINLARALIRQPRLLLLDEPTASLDNATKQAVAQALLTLKKQGTTMVSVFHDLETMKRMVDRVYHVEDNHCCAMKSVQEAV